MGELVSAFNKMKHATEGYINTLKENNEMAELLHKEELEEDGDGETTGCHAAGGAEEPDQSPISCSTH